MQEEAHTESKRASKCEGKHFVNLRSQYILLYHTPQLFILKELVPQTLDSRKVRDIVCEYRISRHILCHCKNLEQNSHSLPHPEKEGCSPPGPAGLRLCVGL